MEVHRLEREFVYNGVKLPDTTPNHDPGTGQRDVHAFVPRNSHSCD
jgi:PRTRC genetic system protein C